MIMMMMMMMMMVFMKIMMMVEMTVIAITSYSCQGWKSNKHPMGNVRKYDPEYMPAASDEVKLSDFAFKLVEIALVDKDKKAFNEKYKIQIPISARSRYSHDVLFGNDWRQLLNDFDAKPLSLEWEG